MDFKNIPVSYQPAYAWNWNGNITREGIKEQIDDMYDSGIKAFYIIPVPKNFRPTFQISNLSPEYMSEEYLDLLYYSFEYATEKGMYTWLYNEGGFPSGMVCGQIREKYPHLAIKTITEKKFVQKKDSPYVPKENLISAFSGGKRVHEGDVFPEDTEITEYFGEGNCAERHINRTDISKAENTKRFIELTHEKMKKKFGKHMGTDVTLMFDDESFMGQWSADFEKDFSEKYGYDIADYMPVIFGSQEPKTEKACRAKSDYIMLCGELVRENYFKGMRKWLNANNMLSTGHVDNDHVAGGIVSNRYGNRMSILRAFDVPGVDEIWGQIEFPENGKSCPMGNEFFPRLASSAANQQGHSRALSESFAVYGSQMTPELMRYIVSYQAIKGISLFNFMSISYDKRLPFALQYRPSFGPENTGMDCLSELNDYTARLSYLLQNSKPEIDTAIYCPYRTISAWGEKGQNAAKAYEDLGNALEKENISFDIIDEDFVLEASVENGVLKGGFVTYKNVFVPEILDFEKEEVTEKLALLKAEKKSDVKCGNFFIKSRKVIFDDGNEAILLCNTDGKTAKESISFTTDKFVYELDLRDGDIYEISHIKEKSTAEVQTEILRGDIKVIFLSTEKITAKKRNSGENYILRNPEKYISRRFEIDSVKGKIDTYCEEKGCCSDAFSGEVTYKYILKDIPEGDYILKTDKINYFAKVFVNGKKAGVSTLPPYALKLQGLKDGDELKIVVANTIANAVTSTEYFKLQDSKNVGPYHENMEKHEETDKTIPGIIGDVMLEKQNGR